MRWVRWVRRLFALELESRAFFLTLAGLHVALKVVLGMRLMAVEGYGLRTLVGPPQSVLLACLDVPICYAAAKVFEWCTPARGRWLGSLHVAVVGGTAFFLAGNFILHGFFKGFLNYGLVRFNGAGPVELLDYTIAGFDRFALLFVASEATIVWAFLRASRSSRTPGFWRRSPWPSLFVLAAALGVLPIWGHFGSGQVGWLIRDPFIDLTTSLARGMTESRVELVGVKLEPGWKPPTHPLFGEYDARLPCARPVLPPHPNVLFLLIESLPLEQTPLDGNTDSSLRVLTELGQSAVTFTQFRAVFPATSRSFIAYHCGTLPNTGPSTVTQLHADFDCDSLPRLLGKRGYRTGFFTASMFNYDSLSRSAMMSAYGTRRDFFDLSAHAKHAGLTDQAVEEEVVSKAVGDFVEAGSEPFFATYFAFWSHAPYRLPFRDVSALPPLERYHLALAYLDGIFRDLFARLEARGVLDRTIIAVAADHGEGFELHHHDNVDHAGHVYEDDVRIPLLIRIPGLGQACRTARNASVVDFAPTLFGLLGVSPPASWDGQDLLAPTFTSRPSLIFSRSKLRRQGIVDGSLKYFYDVESGEEAFYDLQKDPHEEHDLTVARRPTANAYRHEVDQWMAYLRARPLDH